MTIEICVPGRKFSRAFFAPARFEGQVVGDVWGLLYQDPGEPWVFKFRIRTYVTQDPHDQQDQKSWMLANLDQNEDSSISKISQIFTQIFTAGFEVIKLDQPEVTNLSGLSHDQVQEKLLSLRYAHVKPVGTA